MNLYSNSFKNYNFNKIKKKKEHLFTNFKQKNSSLQAYLKKNILYLRCSKKLFFNFRLRFFILKNKLNKNKKLKLFKPSNILTKSLKKKKVQIKKKFKLNKFKIKLKKKTINSFKNFNLWLRFSFCNLWAKRKYKKIKLVLPLKKNYKSFIKTVPSFVFRSYSLGFTYSTKPLNKKKQKIKKKFIPAYQRIKKSRLFFKKHFKFKPKKKRRFLSQKLRRLLTKTKKKKKKKSLVHNTNFLKTTLGQYFINAQMQHIEFNKYLFSTLWKNALKFYNKYRARWSFRWNIIKHKQQLINLQLRHKLGWYYSNIILQKKKFNSKFNYSFPSNFFLTYWIQHKLRPWLDYLQSKRRLYNGLFPIRRKEHYRIKKFIYIPYLQKKKPTRQKKNKLYSLYTKLLFPFWTRGLRNKKKIKHIRQILSKIILPFYGHLNLKQFQQIYKKNYRKKWKNTARYNSQLSFFEQRLDVCAYRLNLAPTIFWARKLIKNGGIFVSSINNSHSWEKLHAHLKKYTFPIKLRDPKSLYKKSRINFFSLLKKPVKLFISPLCKINYKIKPGEIIYCAPNSFLNQFKTNSVLWKKPIPFHFLTVSDLTETKKYWKTRRGIISFFSTPENKLTMVSTLVFAPTFSTLTKNDRINPSFIRWISL